MGNGISHCFCAPGPPRPCRRSRRHLTAAVSSEPLDEGLGHSFCYLSSSSSKPDPALFSISGASVSANPSTALSTALDPFSSSQTPAAFESSARFSSVPLQPVPRPLSSSGSLSPHHQLSGFLSGPIERAFLSGPLDPNPTPNPNPNQKPKKSKPKILHSLRGLARSVLPPPPPPPPIPTEPATSSSSSSGCGGFISIEEELHDSRLQWAQGKAGEDRMHVVVSEEHAWVFVGIYDGFNGPDATDYLLTYLYPAVEKELKGLLWDEGDDEGAGATTPAVDHCRVLEALREALVKTEDTFLDCADMMATENPELALMGSCVLVMLMKGEDVYLMNVGDSRAVLARKGMSEGFDELVSLGALQLTSDHSTSIKEEVVRIRKEHPDDSSAISNDRVKGSLKVTRAFGAGFLKQPKWNNALLEMFRIDYVGTSPYITCLPSLYHHRLSARDRYLILSSDGLCQYFTNEEVVAEVELFISTTPEGDPAQHLVEEMLFRAARKAGMDFHELLEIPQGDRRRYHDDVSIIVISFEGRIWKSCV